MFQRAFSVSTREPAALLFAPGGHSPTRGFVVCAALVHAFYRTSVRSNVCSVDVLRVVWYRAGAFLCLRNCMCDVAVHDRGRAVAVAVVHGRAWPSCVWPWCRVRPCPWWSCRGVLAVSVVSHVCGGVVAVTWRCAWCDCVALCRGYDTPMNASVSNDFHGVSISRFAQSIGCVYSESHQANDNERNRDGREATTTETTTARMVTRSPPNRRGMDD